MPIFAPPSNSSNSARTERSESPQSNDSYRTTREQEQGTIVEDPEMCSEGLQGLDELRDLNQTYDQANTNDIRISEALLFMERSMKIREDQYNKNMQTMRSEIMELKNLLLRKR